VEAASDYLMTTLVATPEHFGVPDEELFRLSPEELWKITIEAISDWHPVTTKLFAHADPDSFFPITIRAGGRVEPWTSGPMTLLGDAMTPCHQPAALARTPRSRIPRRWPASCFPWQRETSH